MSFNEISVLVKDLLIQDTTIEQLLTFQKLHDLVSKSELIGLEKQFYHLLKKYLPIAVPDVRKNVLDLLNICVTKGIFITSEYMDIAHSICEITIRTNIVTPEDQEIWIKAFQVVSAFETIHENFNQTRTPYLINIISTCLSASFTSFLLKMKALEMLKSLIANVKNIETIGDFLMPVWYEQIFPLMFNGSNINFQKTAIDLSYDMLPFLSKFLNKMPKYWEKIDKDILERYASQMKHFVTTENCIFAKLWTFVVKLFGIRFHKGCHLVNLVLSVIECAFKSCRPDIRKEAFYCWQALFECFALEANEMSSEKRITFLMIPLKTNNTKTDELALVKFNVWCKFFDVLYIGKSCCKKVNIEPFLNYCFGPLLNAPLASYFSSSLPPSPGKKFRSMNLHTCKAFLQIFGIRNYIDDDILNTLTYFKFEGPVVTLTDFITYSKLFVNSVGEACILLSSLENCNKFEVQAINAALWKSLFYLTDCVKNTQCRTTITKDISYLILALASVARRNTNLIQFGLVPLFTTITSDEFKFFRDENMSEYLFIPMISTVIKKDKALLQHDIINIFKSIFIYKRNDPNYLTFILNVLQKFSIVLQENTVSEKIMILYKLWFLIEEEMRNYLNKLNVEEVEKDLLLTTFLELFFWPIPTLHRIYSAEELITKWKETYELFNQHTSNALQYKLANLLMQKMHALVTQNSLLSTVAQFVYLIISNMKFDTSTKDESINICEVFNALKNILSISSLKTEEVNIYQACISYFFKSISSLFDFDQLLPIVNNCVDNLFTIYLKFDLFEEIQTFIQSSTYGEKLSLGIIEKLTETLKKCPNKPESGEKVTETDKLSKDSEKEQTTILFGCDIDTMTPINLKGSLLDKTKTKSKNLSPKSTVEKRSTDDEFIIVNSPYKFDPKKLTKQQKEKLSRRRDDIPALYQDLSQSQTQEFSSNSELQEFLEQNHNKNAQDIALTSSNNTNENDKPIEIKPFASIQSDTNLASDCSSKSEAILTRYQKKKNLANNMNAKKSILIEESVDSNTVRNLRKRRNSLSDLNEIGEMKKLDKQTSLINNYDESQLKTSHVFALGKKRKFNFYDVGIQSDDSTLAKHKRLDDNRTKKLVKNLRGRSKSVHEIDESISLEVNSLIDNKNKLGESQLKPTSHVYEINKKRTLSFYKDNKNVDGFQSDDNILAKHKRLEKEKKIPIQNSIIDETNETKKIENENKTIDDMQSADNTVVNDLSTDIGPVDNNIEIKKKTVKSLKGRRKSTNEMCETNSSGKGNKFDESQIKTSLKLSFYEDNKNISGFQSDDNILAKHKRLEKEKKIRKSIIDETKKLENENKTIDNIQSDDNTLDNDYSTDKEPVDNNTGIKKKPIKSLKGRRKSKHDILIRDIDEINNLENENSLVDDKNKFDESQIKTKLVYEINKKRKNIDGFQSDDNILTKNKRLEKEKKIRIRKAITVKEIDETKKLENENKTTDNIQSDDNTLANNLSTEIKKKDLKRSDIHVKEISETNRLENENNVVDADKNKFTKSNLYEIDKKKKISFNEDNKNVNDFQSDDNASDINSSTVTDCFSKNINNLESQLTEAIKISEAANDSSMNSDSNTDSFQENSNIRRKNPRRKKTHIESELSKLKMDIRHSDEYKKNEKRKTRMTSIIDISKIDNRKSPRSRAEKKSKTNIKISDTEEQNRKQVDSNQMEINSEQIIESSQETDKPILLKQKKILIKIMNPNSKSAWIKPDVVENVKISRKLTFSSNESETNENNQTDCEVPDKESTCEVQNTNEILSDLSTQTLNLNDITTQSLSSELLAELNANDENVKCPNEENLICREVLLNISDTNDTEIRLMQSPPPSTSKTNIASSPVHKDTPTRKNELMKCTSEISPIKCSPRCISDAANVATVNSKTNENVFGITPDLFSSEPASADIEKKTDKVTDIVLSSASSSHRKHKTKYPSCRSAQMMDLVSAKSINTTPVRKKKHSCETSTFSSPSHNRITKIMEQFEKTETSEIITEDIDNETIRYEDILCFTKELPSPFASPHASILKKRKIPDDSVEDVNFRNVKRRRVNFSDPIVSCRKFIEKKLKDSTASESRITRASKSSKQSNMSDTDDIDNEFTSNIDSEQQESPIDEGIVNRPIETDNASSCEQQNELTIDSETCMPDEPINSDKSQQSIEMKPIMIYEDLMKSCEVSVITSPMKHKENNNEIESQGTNSNSLFSDYDEMIIPENKSSKETPAPTPIISITKLSDIESTSKEILNTELPIIRLSPSSMKTNILNEHIAEGTVKDALDSIIHLLREKAYDSKPLLQILFDGVSNLSIQLIRMGVIKTHQIISSYNWEDIVKGVVLHVGVLELLIFFCKLPNIDKNTMIEHLLQLDLNDVNPDRICKCLDINDVAKYVTRHYGAADLIKFYDVNALYGALQELYNQSEYKNMLFEYLNSVILKSPTDISAFTSNLSTVQIDNIIINRLQHSVDSTEFFEKIYSIVPPEQYLKPIPKNYLTSNATGEESYANNNMDTCLKMIKDFSTSQIISLLHTVGDLLTNRLKEF